MKLNIIILAVGFIVCSGCLMYAQESDLPSAGPTDEQSQSATSVTDYKEERASDKAALEAEKETIKEHASAAKQEEKDLVDQIKAAERSGDYATADQLRAQLQEVHQANVQEKQQDKQAIKGARQEMRQDKQEALNARMDTNRDGIVDQVERDQYVERPRGGENDNNPPGQMGGPGTNWENRPGPQGGPGSSPDLGGYG